MTTPRFSKQIFGVALALLAASCGNNNVPYNPIVTPATAGPGLPVGGGLGFTGSCAANVAGDFRQNCALCFHGHVQVMGGQPICTFRQEVVAQPYTQGSSPIPILSPSDPSGPLSWPVYPMAGAQQFAAYPITLQAGFHISFAGKGGWGFATTGGSWGGNASCRMNDFGGFGSGMKTRNDVPVNPDNGLPEELFASDGIEAFPLGMSMGDRVVNNTGILRVGFNVPSQGISHGCLAADSLRFTISGCVNSAWTPMSCR